MKLSVLSMFTAFAIILSYVESFIPVVGIPGMKLGLANLSLILIIYIFGIKEALLVSLVRILAVGMMFGNMSMILYSFAGSFLSIIVMFSLKKTSLFHMETVSVAGGFFHNIGQLFIAAMVVKEYKIVYYMPVLTVSGMVTGFTIGIVACSIYKRTAHLFVNVTNN